MGGTITPHHLSATPQCGSSRAAASVRISIACRSPSARSIAWRCARRRPSGGRQFFLGTDTAPHTADTKEVPGCAGVFNAPRRCKVYAQVFFMEENALDRLEACVAERPALLRPAVVNEERITLQAKPLTRAG